MNDEPGTRARLPHAGDFTTDRRVLLLSAMAACVGSAAVLAAAALLALIALCTNLFYHGQLSLLDGPIDVGPLGAASVLVPVVGCLIVGLMARFGSERIRGHGIPEAMEAILIGESRIQPRVAMLKPLSSAISIGSGGPFGAEGPIIMTGGAVGSLFAQCFDMSAAERKALLVAGAAAGMTAVFGTPAAAVLLALEVLLFEWKPRSFIPVIVACLAAAAERHLLLPAAPLFPFHGTIGISVAEITACAALGGLCGLAASLLSSMVYAAEDAFGRLRLHWMWWPALGGLVVGIGGLIEPRALGVGYANLRLLLDGALPASGVLRLLLVKAVIWAVALGSGTSGGVLAPLLITGGAVGALAGHLFPAGAPGVPALLGMAAVMGGTMRAPLTATLFAVELTGDAGMLPPLLAACGISYAVTVLLLPRSILTEKVARRGHALLQEYHVDPLSLVRVRDVMTREVEALPDTTTVAEAVAFFMGPRARHRAYPVLDAARRPLGLVSRADALRWAGDQRAGEQTLRTALAGTKPPTGWPDEAVARLADRMAETGAGRVLILRPGDGTLGGIVGRRDLLRVRARVLAEETRRARFLLRRHVPSPGAPAAATRVERAAEKGVITGS